MIAALETYDETIITEIVKNPKLTGALLGDCFCQRRMFAGGFEEMTELLRLLKDGGKRCWIQTPCYLTDPALVQTMDRLSYWHSRGWVDTVLLQDMGLLRMLHRQIPELPLIWSFMGAARTRTENILHYQFLNTIAPISVAVNRPEHSAAMRQSGLSVALTYGRIYYATINRICYYTYENGLYGQDCGRACLTGSQRLVNERFHQDMSVDGYLLGMNYQYGEAAAILREQKLSGNPLLVYAKDYASCLEKLSQLERGEENL